MRVFRAGPRTVGSNRIFLDDDSSIPFSVDDASKSTLEVDMAEVELFLSFQDTTKPFIL
jgi:hypothetical protein